MRSYDSARMIRIGKERYRQLTEKCQGHASEKLFRTCVGKVDRGKSKEKVNERYNKCGHCEPLGLAYIKIMSKYKE